jgi:hypothetical protein
MKSSKTKRAALVWGRKVEISSANARRHFGIIIDFLHVQKFVTQGGRTISNADYDPIETRYLNLSLKPPDPNPTVLLYSSRLFCVAVARTPSAKLWQGQYLFFHDRSNYQLQATWLAHSAFYRWEAWCPYEMPLDC